MSRTTFISHQWDSSDIIQRLTRRTKLRPLHSVGGTFLLVRRDVVEAGAIFPEEPYQLHIETEGFALMASDLGFGSFMLPQLHVRHGH